MLRTDCKSWWSMWAQKTRDVVLANTAYKNCQMHSCTHNYSFLKFRALFLAFGTLRLVYVSWYSEAQVAGLFNEHSWRSLCPQLQQSTQTGAAASSISTHSHWKWYIFAATILTADCISLVRAVGALWLAVAAPPGRNALAVLTGEVRGRACLLCCGGEISH